MDPFVRLTDVQLRSRFEPEKALLIAESPEVIGRALDGGLEPIALITAEKFLVPLASLLERWSAASPEAPVMVLPLEEIEQLTGFALTRGALAAFRRPSELSAREILEGASLVAVLEDIRNHTNVGAAFRSAAALGADAILVTPACYDPFYRRAVRVSMGTVFQIPWARIGTDPHDWSADGMGILKEAGFTTAAMALDANAIGLDDPRLKEAPRLALVFGTEGDGLAPSTLARCDYTVRIPMAHGVDSLNVAASTAVAFWELRPRTP